MVYQEQDPNLDHVMPVSLYGTGQMSLLEILEVVRSRRTEVVDFQWCKKRRMKPDLFEEPEVVNLGRLRQLVQALKLRRTYVESERPHDHLDSPCLRLDRQADRPCLAYS